MKKRNWWDLRWDSGHNADSKRDVMESKMEFRQDLWELWKLWTVGICEIEACICPYLREAETHKRIWNISLQWISGILEYISIIIRHIFLWILIGHKWFGYEYWDINMIDMNIIWIWRLLTWNMLISEYYWHEYISTITVFTLHFKQS